MGTETRLQKDQENGDNTGQERDKEVCLSVSPQVYTVKLVPIQFCVLLGNSPVLTEKCCY